MTNRGIEIFQYTQKYVRHDSVKGPKVRTKDEFAWSVLFKPESMKANLRSGMERAGVPEERTTIDFHRAVLQV